MPPKRKRSSAAATPSAESPPPPQNTPILPPSRSTSIKAPLPKRQASRRGKVDTNPDINADIIDGKAALRASPDADELGESVAIEKIKQGPPATPAERNVIKLQSKEDDSGSPLSELESQTTTTSPAKKKKSPTKSSIAAKKGSDEIKAFRVEQAAKKAAEQQKIKKEEGGDEWEKRQDPDGDDAGPVEDIDIMKQEAGRPPPVNSDYLPLPWKGRLGYVSSGLSWTVIMLMLRRHV
jgi:UV DNA damage endonuclease